MAEDAETQNNENTHKKKLNRIDDIQKLKSDPPELPLVSIVTLEPQAMEMAGRLMHILNDPVLFNKFKQTLHKKFDLTIHNIDKEINGIKPSTAAAAGGGKEESYFTQEECSFF